MALGDNITAYWKFSNNITEEISALSSSRSGTGAYTTGKIGNAGNFSGSNMVQTANTTLVSGTGASIFAWVKTSNNNIYIASRDGYDSGYSFFMAIGEGTANKLNIILDGTTNGGRQISSSSINDGNRHYVGFTYDGSNVKIYVDGTAETTNAQTGNIVTTSRPFTIGGRRNSDGTPSTVYNGFVGQIDEVATWSRALSGAEVTALYNSGTGLQYPFLTGNPGAFFQMF